MFDNHDLPEAAVISGVNDPTGGGRGDGRGWRQRQPHSAFAISRWIKFVETKDKFAVAGNDIGSAGRRPGFASNTQRRTIERRQGGGLFSAQSKRIYIGDNIPGALALRDCLFEFNRGVG